MAVEYTSETMVVNGTTIGKRSDKLFNLSVKGVVPTRLRVSKDGGSTFTELIHKYNVYAGKNVSYLTIYAYIKNFRHTWSCGNADNSFDSLTLYIVPNSENEGAGATSSSRWYTDQNIDFRLYERGGNQDTKNLFTLASGWHTGTVTLTYGSYVSSGYPDDSLFIQAKNASDISPYKREVYWTIDGSTNTSSWGKFGNASNYTTTSWKSIMEIGNYDTSGNLTRYFVNYEKNGADWSTTKKTQEY